MSTPALADRPPRPGRVPLVEIVVTEAIDAQTVPRLRPLLDEALALRPEQLVLDLSTCPAIDATGVEALLATHRRAIHDGGRLVLRAPSSDVHRNLRLARAAHALQIVWPRATLTDDWCAAAGTSALTNPRLAS